VKVAVTEGADEPIVKLHVPVPEQAPLQPANTDPAVGDAVKVTGLDVLIAVLVHVPDVVPAVEVQLTPPVPVTVPLPVPAASTVTGNDEGMKLAVTDCAEFMVTEQALVPEQAPPQPLNEEPADAVGVRVTVVPCVNESVQVAPQLITPGELVTVPEPPPLVLTVSEKVGAGEKVAVTGTAAVPIVKVQVDVPEQPAPDQPAKTEPEAAAAVSVIEVLVLKLAEQVAPHAIPAGALDTDPEPVPARLMFTGKAAGMKLALTVCAEFIVTEQDPVPEHAPLHPANTEADVAGVAVRVTAVAVSKFAEHVAPQVIPAGALLTDPDPAPVNKTVSGTCGVCAGPNVATTF
jgi:hypothetical protein